MSVQGRKRRIASCVSGRWITPQAVNRRQSVQLGHAVTQDAAHRVTGIADDCRSVPDCESPRSVSTDCSAPRVQMTIDGPLS